MSGESSDLATRDHLRSGDLGPAQISDRTGYTFAAAFQRHFGEPPHRWRQDHGARWKFASRYPRSTIAQDVTGWRSPRGRVLIGWPSQSSSAFQCESKLS